MPRPTVHQDAPSVAPSDNLPVTASIRPSIHPASFITLSVVAYHHRYLAYHQVWSTNRCVLELSISETIIENMALLRRKILHEAVLILIVSDLVGWIHRDHKQTHRCPLLLPLFVVCSCCVASVWQTASAWVIWRRSALGPTITSRKL